MGRNAGDTASGRGDISAKLKAVDVDAPQTDRATTAGVDNGIAVNFKLGRRRLGLMKGERKNE